jgi:type I restriction enzyme, S subunit
MYPDIGKMELFPGYLPGKVNDFIIKEPSELITKQALNECSIRLYPRGSVIIGMIGQGKTRGTTALLDIEACINQNMAAIEPNQKLNSEFLHRYLIQAYQQIRDYGKGANQEALNCDLIKSFKIVIPPINEQLEIVNHLKFIESEVAQLVEASLKELDRLSEYRSVIIANVVTGKIRV